MSTCTLQRLTGPRADRTLHHYVRWALQRLAADPRHPGHRAVHHRPDKPKRPAG